MNKIINFLSAVRNTFKIYYDNYKYYKAKNNSYIIPKGVKRGNFEDNNMTYNEFISYIFKMVKKL